jgi:hypothetical protein
MQNFDEPAIFDHDLYLSYNTRCSRASPSHARRYVTPCTAAPTTTTSGFHTPRRVPCGGIHVFKNTIPAMRKEVPEALYQCGPDICLLGASSAITTSAGRANDNISGIPDHRETHVFLKYIATTSSCGCDCGKRRGNAPDCGI